MNSYLMSQGNGNNEIFIIKIDNKTINKLKFSQIHKNNLFLKKEECESILKIIENKKYEIKFEIENTQIMIIPELNKEELLFYISDGRNDNINLETFLKILRINLYYQNSLHLFENKKRLENILLNLDTFWERYNVTKINLTNSFMLKKFNLSMVKINNYEKNLINNEINNNVEVDYLNDIENYDKNLKQENIYYKVEYENFSDEFINNIYNTLTTEYFKYSFLANLLCSKKYCHLILKNKELLINSKQIFNKYKIAFKYFMSYAWMTFISGELFSLNVNDDDIYVFDLENANLLPKFPFSYDDINQNPYSCFFINNDLLNIKENLLSIDCDKNYENYNGLTTPEEFKRRLNIFCNNKNEEKYLKYIDWDSCAITGSTIYACMMNGYQIMDYNLKRDCPEKYTDDELINYFLQNNQTSDIDIICNKTDTFEFNKTVSDLYMNIKKDNDKVKISKVSTTIFIITTELIESEFEKLKKFMIINKKIRENSKDYVNYTFKDVNIKDKNVIEYFYLSYYKDFKNDINSEYIKFINNTYIDKITIDSILNEELYEIFSKENTEEFSLKLFKYEPTINNTILKDRCQKIYYNKSGDKIYAKMSESLRYKIVTGDSKVMEIFKSRNKNFLSTIGKFHFSMVRGFWNGKTLKVLPSLITSSMINLSHDNKYFSATTHPAKIANKYRMNGPCGILCNLSGRRDITLHMLKHNIEYEEFEFDSTKSVSENVKKIFGLYRKNDSCDSIKLFDENFNKIIIPALGFMNKLKGIDNKGSAIPVNKNYINIFYDKINEHIKLNHKI
jgi:hypothetical protein